MACKPKCRDKDGPLSRGLLVIQPPDATGVYQNILLNEFK